MTTTASSAEESHAEIDDQLRRALCASHHIRRQYLGVNTQDAQIHVSDTPDNAWVFRTHDGAVTHALWIGEVHGETPDVIKLDL